MSDLKVLQHKKKSNALIFLAPLIIVSMLSIVFLFRLFSGDTTKLPSALIAKPVPEFNLTGIPNLMQNGVIVSGFSSSDLKQGKVSIVNMFASWCPECRQEHDILLTLAKDERINLFGIDYKDDPEKARKFLELLGNPYKAVGVDRKGAAAIDWGLYGVPETFIISSDGHILYKKVGPMSEETLKSEIMPEIEKALTKACCKKM
jgi:cytochrome c biogenesis protein CcmG, thiol:disulfide interchange protein DsbE